jgi:hypothetical protein
MLLRFLMSLGSFQVEGEQILEYLFVREIERPAVGGEDRLIEPLVGVH